MNINQKCFIFRINGFAIILKYYYQNLNAGFYNVQATP